MAVYNFIKFHFCGHLGININRCNFRIISREKSSEDKPDGSA